MSTPKWKKLARQREHTLAKEQKKYSDFLASTKRLHKKKKISTGQYVPPQPLYTREVTPTSATSCGGIAHKKEPMKYTGTLIKGIATMHKSNAVPILNKQQATDISNMEN